MCDDLTPVGVEAPTSHATEVHGSDPACYSCHYKLDPMAGYFRELGIYGMSFAKSPVIFFDDQVQMEREVYEKPWRTTDNPSREWDIGFIRSTIDTSKNIYGSNFSDLLKFLQKSPEVKECFVRRAFEYLVGEEQTYDKLWGHKIVEKMNATAVTNKSLAIKEVFAEIVTSKAFQARTRDPNKCYDLPEGVKASERAPCRIAAIIEKNCTSCHSDSNNQGGLNLSKWKKQHDGEFGFSVDSSNQHKTTKSVFQSMIDRLSTADSAQRMPLMKTMPDSERQELYVWLSNKLFEKELNK